MCVHYFVHSLHAVFGVETGFRIGATQIPPIPATHTGSSTDVVENLEENALATAKEQGDEQEWSLILWTNGRIIQQKG